MMVQLKALTAQVSELLEEIRQLRRENYDLRRQVELARGLQQHDPYPRHPDGSSSLTGDVPMLSGLTGNVRPRTPPRASTTIGDDASVNSPETKRIRGGTASSSGAPAPTGVGSGADGL